MLRPNLTLGDVADLFAKVVTKETVSHAKLDLCVELGGFYEDAVAGKGDANLPWLMETLRAYIRRQNPRYTFDCVAPAEVSVEPLPEGEHGELVSVSMSTPVGDQAHLIWLTPAGPRLATRI